MMANRSLAMKSEPKYNKSIFIQDNKFANTFCKMTDIVCRRPELIKDVMGIWTINSREIYK